MDEVVQKVLEKSWAVFAVGEDGLGSEVKGEEGQMEG